jgi:hypothetical protein
LVRAHASKSDDQILQELAQLPPLEDEDHPCWNEEEYWLSAAYPYIAFAQVARNRRLTSAIPVLLDRACFGDPGEIMRGLRHHLEAIVSPNWSVLAALCISAAQSSRLGTQLWAVDQLMVLDDARAKPIFEEASRSNEDEIRWRGEVGLKRLQSRAG